MVRLGMVAPLDHPLSSEILQGIQQEVGSALCWSVVAGQPWQTAPGLSAVLGESLDLLILLDGAFHPTEYAALAAQYPTLTIGPHSHFRDNHVQLDAVAASELATRHLLEMGHQHIAFVGSCQHGLLALHQKGFLDAIGKTAAPLLLAGDGSEKSGHDAVLDLLARQIPFTALITSNARMASGARLALYRRGLQVPHDVSLLALEDTSSTPCMIPPLTTVHFPGEQLGQHIACALLLNQIQPPLPHVLLPALLLRESTTSPRTS
ncbi:hypothetical protein GCM10008938_30600 [Deinococcus roseus]|uniref:Transcriptional regulator LacI/GalR-like sensor domain-containing protein n=1 Tax=Deinococcus roseus TaxID=392414 RepID=A0ABQ2D1T6_9DEIO|nr:hypothetical protein GCM10008938_30600 [Deinococcus roseus]